MAGRQAVDFRLYLCKARVQCFGASLSSSQTYSEEVEAAGRATNSELPPRDSRWCRDYVYKDVRLFGDERRRLGAVHRYEAITRCCNGGRRQAYRVASPHAILCLHQLSSGAERKHASE